MRVKLILTHRLATIALSCVRSPVPLTGSASGTLRAGRENGEDGLNDKYQLLATIVTECRTEYRKIAIAGLFGPMYFCIVNQQVAKINCRGVA